MAAQNSANDLLFWIYQSYSRITGVQAGIDYERQDTRFIEVLYNNGCV